MGDGLAVFSDRARLLRKQARESALAHVPQTSGAGFDFFLLYFWQATLILMIATLWLGWLRLSGDTGPAMKIRQLKFGN